MWGINLSSWRANPRKGGKYLIMYRKEPNQDYKLCWLIYRVKASQFKSDPATTHHNNPLIASPSSQTNLMPIKGFIHEVLHKLPHMHPWHCYALLWLLFTQTSNFPLLLSNRQKHHSTITIFNYHLWLTTGELLKAKQEHYYLPSALSWRPDLV